MLKKIIKDPIFYFFVAGAVLYLVHQLLNPDSANSYSDKIIVVDELVLKNLLNIRNRNPELEYDVDIALAALSSKEKNALASKYIEEEALYRMALEMGLNENDYIIKQRMIQKLQFLLEDLNTNQIDIHDKNLVNYYKTNADKFKTASTLSFGHVFLSSDQHNDNIFEKANSLLELLNKDHTKVRDAVRQGDRFPLNHFYTDVSSRQVTSHFGKKFSAGLFDLETQTLWQGPLRSSYGYHLVYISNKEAGQIPTFDSIRNSVTDAYKYEEKKRLNRIARQSIIDKYSVVKEYE
jgi:peptidyl-prolyl cis-trans isomerase C